MNQPYEDLVREYRIALGLWSEACALYAPDGPELIAAAMHLEELETEMRKHRVPVAA
jgi:hypothetical protein